MQDIVTKGKHAVGIPLLSRDIGGFTKHQGGYIQKEISLINFPSEFVSFNHIEST